MPSLETLWSFFGISLLLALSPGPDNLFVLVQSAQQGWRAGLCVVLGLCSGLVVHTSAVALGLAAVLAASPLAFQLLQWLGAAYLCWLAWGAWHAPVSLEGAQASAIRSPWRMWARGVLMNLTNPKVLIFFLAFLPQFTAPEQGPVGRQILLLGALFMLAALLVFGAIALFSGFFGRLLQRSARAQKMLNRFSSLVFLGLALRLAR